MSTVTGVVLCTSVSEEDDPLREILAMLADWNQKWTLQPVEDHFGGDKHPQMMVLGGGFNHFEGHWERLVAAVVTARWRNPENVLLILQPEDSGTSVFGAAPLIGNHVTK
jgi:hypothetical protein